MKSSILRNIIIFLLILFATDLFAFGRRQVQEEPEELNPEWVLYITALDVSSLPLSRQLLGDTVARTISDTLSNLNIRFRRDEEYAYYRDYAWARSRSEAAAALVSRRNERDQLIYRGNPSWRYERDLKAADQAILGLEEELAKIEALAPVVEGRPVFMLGSENRSGNFPQPPGPGEEYRFCVENDADALLSGRLSEFHGRIFLELRMYTLYSRSYSFEYSVLFSSNDFNDVMEEVSSRLALAVSESYPASILVHASVDEAMLLINDRLVDLGERHTLSPGMAEISIQAENHRQLTFPVELFADELAEVYIDLSPFALVSFGVDVPASPGTRVFLGSQYVGEAPLTLLLPRNEYFYISVETPDAQVGTTVVRDNTLLRGSARFTRDPADSGAWAEFQTMQPISPEEARVETARYGFYRSYGAFWIILPASLLAAGIAGTYIAADDYVTANNIHIDPVSREKLSSNASFGRVVSYASYGAIGVSLGMTFVQIFRYIRASREDPTPIVRVAE